MPPIREILVPLDGSREAEPALRHGRGLARPLGARLHLIRVVAPSDRNASRDPVQWRMERSEAEGYLRETAQSLEEDGLEVEESVLSGEPADEIVSYARRNAVDVVVLTPTGRGRCRGAPVGGTAYKVIYRIGTSVFLARPDGEASGDTSASADGDEYRRVLVPVDGSPPSEWALHAAASLLPDSGGELVAARALKTGRTPEDETTPVDGEERRGRSTRADARGDARSFLARARRQLDRPGLTLDSEVIPAAHVAQCLHALAEKRDADLVLLSAHGRSGAARWPYGSVATNLLLHGRRPTLVLQDQPELRQAEPPPREESVRPVRRRPRSPGTPHAGDENGPSPSRP